MRQGALSVLDLERLGRARGHGRAHLRLVGASGIDHEFAVFDLEDLRQRLYAIARMDANVSVPGDLNCHRQLLPSCRRVRRRVMSALCGTACADSQPPDTISMSGNLSGTAFQAVIVVGKGADTGVSTDRGKRVVGLTVRDCSG